MVRYLFFCLVYMDIVCKSTCTFTFKIFKKNDRNLRAWWLRLNKLPRNTAEIVLLTIKFCWSNTNYNYWHWKFWSLWKEYTISSQIRNWVLKKRIKKKLISCFSLYFSQLFIKVVLKLLKITIIYLIPCWYFPNSVHMLLQWDIPQEWPALDNVKNKKVLSFSFHLLLSAKIYIGWHWVSLFSLFLCSLSSKISFSS